MSSTYEVSKSRTLDGTHSTVLLIPATMPKPAAATPPVNAPGAVDAERITKLRKAAIPVTPHTGFVTDYDNGCVLVVAKHRLHIEETVITIPLGLLMAAATNVMGQVAVPMLAQLERAKSVTEGQADGVTH